MIFSLGTGLKPVHFGGQQGAELRGFLGRKMVSYRSPFDKLETHCFISGKICARVLLRCLNPSQTF